jgi:hypothetical protein
VSEFIETSARLCSKPFLHSVESDRSGLHIPSGIWFPVYKSGEGSVIVYFLELASSILSEILVVALINDDSDVRIPVLPSVVDAVIVNLPHEFLPLVN